ncbi:hypothetical protein KCP75_04940 [Salmonella enterica subsp. enterica]|nr:hypothetical protein KCP75_04940 [Salmonella enterica subsp. enterica]
MAGTAASGARPSLSASGTDVRLPYRMAAQAVAPESAGAHREWRPLSAKRVAPKLCRHGCRYPPLAPSRCRRRRGCRGADGVAETEPEAWTGCRWRLGQPGEMPGEILRRGHRRPVPAPDILLLPALRQFRQFSQQVVALRGTGCPLCETLHAGFKAASAPGGETLLHVPHFAVPPPSVMPTYSASRRSASSGSPACCRVRSRWASRRKSLLPEARITSPGAEFPGYPVGCAPAKL